METECSLPCPNAPTTKHFAGSYPGHILTASAFSSVEILVKPVIDQSLWRRRAGWTNGGRFPSGTVQRSACSWSHPTFYAMNPGRWNIHLLPRSKMVELYLHSHIHLHGLVFNQLSIRKILSSFLPTNMSAFLPDFVTKMLCCRAEMKWQGVGESCIMRSFTTCTLRQV
jgi:hypothetical protein